MLKHVKKKLNKEYKRNISSLNICLNLVSVSTTKNQNTCLAMMQLFLFQILVSIYFQKHHKRIISSLNICSNLVSVSTTKNQNTCLAMMQLFLFQILVSIYYQKHHIRTVKTLIFKKFINNTAEREIFN